MFEARALKKQKSRVNANLTKLLYIKGLKEQKTGKIITIHGGYG
jgi:hypothetical protein